MNHKFTSYDDLLAERQRLTIQLEIHRQHVKAGAESLKESLQPVNTVLGFVGKLVSRNNSHPLLNAGIDLGANLLVKKLLLSKAGWIARLIVPFVVKNYASNAINGDNTFSGKLKRIFTRN